MIVPIATTAVLLLFLTPSCGYVSSLRDSYRLWDSTRTLPYSPSVTVLDHPQRRSHQCCYGHGTLSLAATNDPIDPPSLTATPSSQLQLSGELLDRLQEYIDKWRLEARLLDMSLKSYTDANESNSSVANAVGKNVNLLAMFQPSGFYKDQNALQLAARADKSMPYDPHVSYYTMIHSSISSYLVAYLIKYPIYQ